MNLVTLIRSRRKFSAPIESKTDAVKHLLDLDIPFFEGETPEERFVFYVFEKHAAEAEKLSFVRSEGKYGAAVILKRNKNRIGLLIGSVLCLFTMMFLSRFVWDIRVVNNSKIDEERIIDALDSAGLRIGSYIPDISKRRTENLVLQGCPELSYISLNVKGNTVYATVSERKHYDEEIPKYEYSHLTAREDGVIVRYECNNGTVACRIGETVIKGDVLISGNMETKHHGIVPVRAEGRVMAKVERSVEVYVPFISTETLETGRTSDTHKLFIGGIGIPIDRNNSEFDCENEYTDRTQLIIFGVIRLPVYIEKTVFAETVKVRVEHSDEETKKLAEEKYLSKVAAAAYNSELLYEVHETERTENGYIVSGKIGLITDISEETELIIENTS